MHRGNFLLQSGSYKDRAYSVGIDASLTSFGVYFYPLNGDEWFGFTVKTDGKETSDTSRILAISDAVEEEIDKLEFPVHIAVFEDYGQISNRSGKIAVRAEMVGMLKKHFLRTLRVPVVTVAPVALKSFATGNGLASKDDMVVEASVDGFEAATHDEADAYFAAKLGVCILNDIRTGILFTRTNP